MASVATERPENGRAAVMRDDLVISFGQGQRQRPQDFAPLARFHLNGNETLLGSSTGNNTRRIITRGVRITDVEPDTHAAVVYAFKFRTDRPEDGFSAEVNFNPHRNGAPSTPDNNFATVLYDRGLRLEGITFGRQVPDKAGIKRQPIAIIRRGRDGKGTLQDAFTGIGYLQNRTVMYPEPTPNNIDTPGRYEDVNGLPFQMSWGVTDGAFHATEQEDLPDGYILVASAPLTLDPGAVLDVLQYPYHDPVMLTIDRAVPVGLGFTRKGYTS